MITRERGLRLMEQTNTIRKHAEMSHRLREEVGRIQAEFEKEFGFEQAAVLGMLSAAVTDLSVQEAGVWRVRQMINSQLSALAFLFGEQPPADQDPKFRKRIAAQHDFYGAWLRQDIEHSQ